MRTSLGSRPFAADRTGIRSVRLYGELEPRAGCACGGVRRRGGIPQKGRRSVDLLILQPGRFEAGLESHLWICGRAVRLGGGVVATVLCCSCCSGWARAEAALWWMSWLPDLSWRLIPAAERQMPFSRRARRRRRPTALRAPPRIRRPTEARRPLATVTATAGLIDIVELDRQLLTRNNGYISSIAWSSQDSLIAFQGLIYREVIVDDDSCLYLSSPDGHCNYVSKDHGLYILNPEDNEVQRLTDIYTSDHALRWSPDGSQIIFNTRDIYAVNVNDANYRRLTSDVLSRTPAWSPDGFHIAFSKAGEGFDSRFDYIPMGISVMKEDGTDKQQLTYSTLYMDWNPVWLTE